MDTVEVVKDETIADAVAESDENHNSEIPNGKPMNLSAVPSLTILFIHLSSLYARNLVRSLSGLVIKF